MRSNWWRWLWGTIPLLLLGWLAVEAEHKRIERDLQERSAAELAKVGLSWAQTGFQGRDGVLSGKASDVADPDKALSLLAKVWGVRVVDNKADLIDQVENYHWSVSRVNNRVRLTGYVPNSSVRQVILGVARASFPGFEIQDRMKLGRGAPNPDAWLGGVSFGLKQLTSLKRGDARLEMLNLTITGEAEDAAAYRTLNSSLANSTPKGIKLAGFIITPPVVSPHDWFVRFDGAAMNFKGLVPSDAIRAEIIAAAREKLPENAVTDDTEPGDGVAPGWREAALLTVRQLRRLENGTAEIRDGHLALVGTAPDDATAEAVRAALRTVPAAYKLTENVSVKQKPKPAEPPPAPATVPPPPPPPDLSKELQPARTPAPVTSNTQPPQVAPPVPLPAPAPTLPPPAPREEKPRESAIAPPPPAPKAPRASTPPDTKPATPEVRAAKACQDNLRTLAAGGTILFRYGSAELSPASSETLDKLAAAAKDCPDMLIEIGGYASAEGAAWSNLRLSLSRAQSVRGYLAKAGVDAQQLEAKGYGIEKPAAPNTSPENMAKNRRIEFTVRPKSAADAQRQGSR